MTTVKTTAATDLLPPLPRYSGGEGRGEGPYLRTPNLPDLLVAVRSGEDKLRPYNLINGSPLNCVPRIALLGAPIQSSKTVAYTERKSIPWRRSPWSRFVSDG